MTGASGMTAVVEAGGGEQGERSGPEWRELGLRSPVKYDPAVVELVTGSAPDLFALVEKDAGKPESARVALFGLAFDGWSVVVAPDGSARERIGRAEELLGFYAESTDLVGELVWITPDLVLKMLLGR